MTFEVRCACGNVLRGRRLTRQQLVSCPGCGRGVFVFPASQDAAVAPAPVVSAHRRAWRVPVLVAGVSILLATLGVVLFLRNLHTPPRDDVEDGAVRARRQLAEGRTALREGKFNKALAALNQAIEQRKKQPELLSSPENRELHQLQREADILVRLLPCSLEKIVQNGKLERHKDEWEAKFAPLRGKSVLFDDAVRQDDEGRPTLANYSLAVDKEPIRLALEGVRLLREVGADPEFGGRWIFGVRLESCRLEEGGVWVIRFEEDSGVLLTQDAAVEAAYSVPPGDLREILSRQQRWLAERPVEKPARP